MSTVTEQSSYRPVDDFDNYVNHQWKSDNTIPDDRSRWSTIDVMREQNFIRQRELLEVGGDNLVNKFYSLLMEQPEMISTFVTDLLNKVDFNESSDYFNVAFNMFKQGVGSIFHVCKLPDAKDPDTYVPVVIATGLLLPDRDYYTDKTEFHEATKQYMFDLAALHNLTLSQEDVNAVFEFENQLALKHHTQVQKRDPELTYNPLTVNKVIREFPEFNVLLGGLSDEGKVIVRNLDHFRWLRDFVLSTPVNVLQNHLRLHIMDAFVNYGPEELFMLGFNFHGKLLSGQAEPQPRWKRSISTVNSIIGDELGKLYAAKYFDQQQQHRCADLISFLKLSYQQIIERQTWMSPTTKEFAIKKLAKIGTSKVGVPSKWHSIDGLWQNEQFNDIVETVLNWGIWDWETQEYAKFYTQVDRELWHMTPQTVNAYYDPLMNEIVFPAGILQSPFFSDSTIANFAAIGVVIGHEMTHGFDDEGSKYTTDGKLEEWWSEADRQDFESRTKTVVEHYNSLTSFGKNVNGELTLGENIADIGGLRIALNGLKMKFGRDLTNDELREFFTVYATIQRGLIKEEYAHKLLTLDPHSPKSARINGALVHIDEFRNLYGLAEGDKMYLSAEKMMQIW